MIFEMFPGLIGKEVRQQKEGSSFGYPVQVTLFLERGQEENYCNWIAPIER